MLQQDSVPHAKLLFRGPIHSPFVIQDITLVPVLFDWMIMSGTKEIVNEKA